MEDRDYLSFAEFLKGFDSFPGVSRDYFYIHNGILYGKSMDYSTVSIYHKEDIMKRIAVGDSKRQFRPILVQFINYIVQNNHYKNKIFNYSDNEKFGVYNDEEYENKINQMNDPSTFRDTNFEIDGSIYHMSTNVKIPDQMLYCCNIIDYDDLENWYFSTLSSEENNSNTLDNEIAYQNLTDSELYAKYKRMIQQRKITKKNKTNHSTSTYIRSPEVSEIAKRRANGICDLSLNHEKHNGPFKINGRYYLESHHVKWLSDGGNDDIDNVVALCPNCHKKMHLINDKKDVEFLKKRIMYYKSKK